MSSPYLIDAGDIDGNSALTLAAMKKAHLVVELLQPWSKEPVPSEDWLSEKITQDADAARVRVAEAWAVPEGLKKIVKFPELFSENECDVMWEAVEAVAKQRGGWQRLQDRHRGYATTDLQVAKVPDIYPFVQEALTQRLFPKLATCYSLDIETFRFRDLFFVKYDTSKGAQRGVGIHRDGSNLSFNVLLNNATDFEGGGTFIEQNQETYLIDKGEALVHSGKLRHSGVSITSGRRCILVGFIDVGTEGHLELHFQD